MISDQQLLRALRSEARVALFGDLVRALALAAIVVVFYFFGVYYASLGQQMFAELEMNDFGKFYYSAKAFMDGDGLYGPTRATLFRGTSGSHHLWNMNPPHFHLLVLPLALLSPLPALLAWATLNVLALIAALRIIARTLGLSWSLTRVVWTTVGVVVCSATGIIVVTGQLTFLLMLPMTMAWSDARRGRWTRAAVTLGVLASLKPFLGIFALCFLVRRRFFGLAWMGLGVAASVMAGLTVFGWREYADWIDVLGRVDWTWAPMNASIHGLISRALTENLLFVPIAPLPNLVGPLVTVLNVVLLLITATMMVRDRSALAVDRAFAGLVLLSLLVSPLGWMYYLWLAAGPLVALWRALDLTRIRLDGVLVLLAVPGLLLPIYTTIVWRAYPWGAVTLGSTYTWTVLCLWGAVVQGRRTGDIGHGSARIFLQSCTETTHTCHSDPAPGHS